jgi:hypothetical protein
MKTTLILSPQLWARLKATAARQGKTMSEIVDAALRSFLQQRSEARRLPPLPAFTSGGASVDVADRDELYRRMEGR